MEKFLLTENRIPTKYFVTKGKGQDKDAIHPGSYDAAVRDAKMENWNGVGYTSLLPPDAKQVPIPENYLHGSELMMIMARCDCNKGQKANAALGKAWVCNEKGDKVGGLVAEYSKIGETIDEKIAVETLRKSLNRMFKRRKYPSHYELRENEVVGYESIVPEETFGTALVAIGFVEYKTKILEQ